MANELDIDRTRIIEEQMAEPSDTEELVEELADTATIEQLFDTYLVEVSDMFQELLEVSADGNPVRTHLELQAVAEDVLGMAYQLRADLIARIANRAEQFPTNGDHLTKQVVEGDEEASSTDVSEIFNQTEETES